MSTFFLLFWDSDSADCVEQFLPPSGSTTGPVHFVCKKYATCDRLDCIPNPKRPEKCYRLLQPPPKGYFDHFEAETACDLHGGSLLVLDSMEDFRFIKSQFNYEKYWLAMKGELEQKNFQIPNCQQWTGGLKSSLDNYKKLYWDITWNQTRIDITKQNYPKGFDVDFRTQNPKKDENPKNCFVIDFRDNSKVFKTRTCLVDGQGYPPATLCEFSTSRKKQCKQNTIEYIRILQSLFQYKVITKVQNCPVNLPRFLQARHNLYWYQIQSQSVLTNLYLTNVMQEE